MLDQYDFTRFWVGQQRALVSSGRGQWWKQCAHLLVEYRPQSGLELDLENCVLFGPLNGVGSPVEPPQGIPRRAVSIEDIPRLAFSTEAHFPYARAWVDNNAVFGAIQRVPTRRCVMWRRLDDMGASNPGRCWCRWHSCRPC